MNHSNKLLKLSNILRKSSKAQEKLQLLLPLLIKDQIFENRIFISGGYVRDLVKGISSNDLDLVVQLNGGSKLFCQYLIHLFDGYVVYQMLNPLYPTYNIKFKQNIEYNGKIYNVKGASLDISDTSLKRFSEDSGKEKLFIYGNLYQDACQRDFTINSLFKNISTNKILDLTKHGLQDIKNNLLRTIPNINKNSLLYNNPKIMLRYCRFFAKYKMNYLQQDVQKMREYAQRVLTLQTQSIIKQLKKVTNDQLELYITMAKNIEIYQYIEKYLNSI